MVYDQYGLLLSCCCLFFSELVGSCELSLSLNAKEKPVDS